MYKYKVILILKYASLYATEVNDSQQNNSGKIFEKNDNQENNSKDIDIFLNKKSDISIRSIILYVISFGFGFLIRILHDTKKEKLLLAEIEKLKGKQQQIEDETTIEKHISTIKKN